MVREGYKQTKVGVIPEDWDATTLGSVAEVIMGQSPKGTSYNRDGNGLPLINGPTEFTKKYPIKVQWTTEPTKLCKPLDLLLCVRGSSTGRMNIANDEFCLGRGVAAIRANSKANTEYLTYQVHLAVEKLLALSAGSTFPSVDSKAIKSIPVPCPRPEEQRSIAQALSDVDALIASLDKLIAKKRYLKTATMQQLLTGKKRLPGFGEGKGERQTEIGVIPEDWEVNSLGEITEYIKGFAFKSSDFQAYGVRVIRVSDTTFDFIKNESEIFIDEKKAKNFRKWAMREGDLIISTVGSKPPMYDSMVGKATFVDAKNANSLLNQNAVIIRCKDWSLEAQVFLHNHLRQPKYIDHIEKIFRGNANQASITLKELFNFLIPTPKGKEEQREIATVLSDMDAEIAALETRLAKTQALKQGMMQELLTGKTRLV